MYSTSHRINDAPVLLQYKYLLSMIGVDII